MIINISYEKNINEIPNTLNNDPLKKLYGSNKFNYSANNDLKPYQNLVDRLATNEILLLAQNDEDNIDNFSGNTEPGLEPVGFPAPVHTLKDTSDAIQQIYNEGLSSDSVIHAATSIAIGSIKGPKINTHEVTDAVKKKVKDLEPLHSKDVVGERPDLQKLSDKELMNSVNNPENKDPIKVNTKTGKVVDGNSRTYELQRRATDPNSTITPDTEVPVQNYTPNNSSFWDL